MVERIKALCKKNGISIAALEKQLGFANGSIVKTDEKTQSGRIQAIANYFHVSMEYLMTGEEESQKYYFDDETAKTFDSMELAQKMSIKQQAYNQLTDEKKQECKDKAKKIAEDVLKKALDGEDFKELIK